MQRTGGILNLYNEENFLQLSGIQHFSFCRRQWALAYIEMQWQENVRTVEGKILHENAHDAGLKEKRGDLIIVRAMPIHSRELGVSGECDVVEFHKAQEGISLSGKEGLYKVVPIEYKFGYFTSSSSGIMFRRNVMLYDTIRIYLLWRNEASYENRIYRGDTGKSQKYICRNA